MRSFVRHTLKSTLFFAGLFILLVISSYIVAPKNNDKASGMRFPTANAIVTEPENTIDVIFLGDSECYRAFNPMKLWEDFGITSYCCATPAQKLCDSEEYLKKALRKQSPKVVILETNAVFRYFSLEETFISNTDSVMPVFYYHNRWKSLTKRDLDPAVEYTYSDAKKGYRYSKKKSAASTQTYMKDSNGDIPISSRNIKYLKKLKTLCDESGAKLIFVSTPSTKNWNTKRHNSIEKIAKEMDVDYIDLNLMKEEVPIDWAKDTADKGDHMNYYGALKVTSFIGGYLAEKEQLSGHKDDEAYKNWNTQAELFNREAERKK